MPETPSPLTEAIVLHRAGRLADAERIYRDILAAHPDDFDCLHLLGVISHQRGDHAQAVRRIDSALERNPENAVALNNRGNALLALGRFAEALASYDRALALQPDYAEAHSNRATALHALKRFTEAVAASDRALALRPDHAHAHSNRGNILHALGRLDEALASYDRALALQPDYAEAHSNRGVSLHAAERFAEALASHDRALALRPDYAEAHYNRGNSLHELGRFAEALASYDRALALRPNYADAHFTRGNSLRELGRFAEALASYDRALTLRPDYAEAHFNEAICRLLIGDFERGWAKHEWRWEPEQLRDRKWRMPRPQWTGADAIRGKTILLHAEQGLGDTIQFCRYVPLVEGRGARVILAVQKPLQALMSTLSATARIIAMDGPVPAFDLHCPLLSLPLAFATRLETIPADTPYLAAPASKTRVWRERFSTHERPRIGLAWAGDPRKRLPGAHRLDGQRSIAFARLEPVLAVTNCEFYSLQKGSAAVTQLRDSPLRRFVIDWTDDLHDFADTAALMENLDLVITVDTSVAHLAGALGKPFWLLNRHNTCWRWLLGRDDSPWYPTARLFRQDETRDWQPVIARAAAALDDYVRGWECDQHRRVQ
jgi:tetratricopeptide (TPR) repeat protein